MKTYQLPKEFAEKWVKALRSKKYKQGVGYLCDDGTYCCLGVAAMISGLDESEIEYKKVLQPEFATGKIPDEIIGNASDKKLIGFLVTKNDGQENAETNPNGEKWGFRKIASWIEQNVEFV
jgi:hypothetical protein